MALDVKHVLPGMLDAARLSNQISASRVIGGFFYIGGEGVLALVFDTWLAQQLTAE